MAGSFDWSSLRVVEEGSGDVVIAPCLAFTIWLDRTDQPVLLDFYERVMETVGPLFTHYRAEHMKRPAKITPRALTMLPVWFKKPAEAHFYYAEFRGGVGIHGASFEVYYQHHPRLTPAQQEASQRDLPSLAARGWFSDYSTSTFRVTLPIEHPLAAPDRFAEWVLDFAAVAKGEFVTGGCDLALNYDYGRGDMVMKRVKALCSLYPGLDWLNHSMHNYLIRYEPTPELLPLIKRAGWITFAHERSVEWLGGAAKLAETLKGDPTVRIHQLAHGLAIQSGEAPRIGDLSRLDIPYRSVAAAIRPVRIDRVGDVRYPDEWMGEWLGVLDKPLPGEER